MLNQLLAPYLKDISFTREIKIILRHYVTSLKILAKDCAFGNSEDENVRDRLVFGLVKFIFEIHTIQQTPDQTKIMIDNYADVFESIGHLPGICKLTLKEGSIPTVQPLKRVTFALEKKLKAELDCREQLKVIAKVTKPTEWVNAVVIVEKANRKASG
ncbi:hypothetical protein QYM36_014589 [Artemia franciscana]|uniref:Uncharacterized protein n=1 Tax=Artemia franciscana TaxID=6661 RepID=A0AA88HNV1_ARTSF|nr:hypothetical protein QYM36_014589 [Artemia franciscana]